MKALTTILLSFLALTATHSTLQVYMPICAVTEINGLVNYTLANFGHILYGRTTIGELIIPQNSQFCNSDNNQTFSNFSGEDIKKFVLIKRGTCKFTKKILNAQKKGADMVIIYDNEKSSVPNVIMSNDGHGHLINIPSVFISNFDGQRILKTYQKCNKSMIMKIHFDVYTSKIANVTFWLDINNRESFITLRDFSRDYHKAIQKYTNYDLKFKINQNCVKEQCEPTDCIKENKYYCLTSDKVIQGVPVQGKQLINEELRSYFLFQAMKQKNTIDKWFEYMVQFDQNLCMEKLDLKQCSLNIMNKYVKPEQIEAKVMETYSNISTGKENILTSFVDEAYRSDILFYPEASINGRNFYGLFRASDIFEMICQSLERPPSQCHRFIKNDRKQTFGDDQSVGVWKTVLLIILFMMLLFFAALFIYNRLIKKQLNQQMSMQVNKMVEHYVAMTEQKSRSHASMA